jgi:hypothetical protein
MAVHIGSVPDHEAFPTSAAGGGELASLPTAEQPTVASRELVAAVEAGLRAVVRSSDHNKPEWFYLDPQVSLPMLGHYRMTPS